MPRPFTGWLFGANLLVRGPVLDLLVTLMAGMAAPDAYQNVTRQSVIGANSPMRAGFRPPFWQQIGI